MIVFIDESGIHRQSGQSSAVLVYVAVGDLDSLNRTIIQAEKDLGITNFHWSKHIWKIRQAFLESVKKERFAVKVALLKNPFSEEILEAAITCLLVEKRIKNVVIDGKKPRRYVLRLKQVLRYHGASVKKIRMGDDRSFPCLRLADLFAGLVRAYFEEPENEQAKKLYYSAKNKITTQTWLGGQDTD